MQRADGASRMRVALISDIHGNLVSLEAVLEDIAKEDIDEVICLGDVAATGPQPRETIRRLRGMDCPVVMGNADAWFLKPEPRGGMQNLERFSDIDLWCFQQLRSEDLEYVRSFRPYLELTLEEATTLLCFHGSPRSNTDVIATTTPDEELDQMLSGYQAAVMAGGHTHVQMLRRHRDTIIVNPGSVGLPFEISSSTDRVRNPPWAEYAVLRAEGSIGVELRRAAVDVEAVVQTALKSGMPHGDWWSSEWG